MGIFQEWVQKKLNEDMDWQGVDVVTSLRNTLANCRKDPFHVLGDGLKHALEAAVQQGDQNSVKNIQNLQTLAMQFMNDIRPMIQHNWRGRSTAPENDPEYQQRYDRFMQQADEILKRQQLMQGMDQATKQISNRVNQSDAGYHVRPGVGYGV